MHKNFAEWYRMVNIEPNSELLEKRWEGIEEFNQSEYTSTDVLELVRLFYNTSVSRDFKEKFIDFFAAVDSAFPRTKGGLEHSVLAGATLLEMIEEESIYSDLAMLATRCLAFPKKTPIILDIHEQILQQFNRKTAHIRENMPKEEANPQVPPIKPITVTIGVDNSGWSEEHRKALLNYCNSINQFLTQQNKINNSNKNLTKISLEDSRILWWLVGQWSNDLDVPFANFSSSYSVAITAGKELADIVLNLPGPYSSKAILYQVINTSKKNKVGQNELSNIIDELSKSWKQSLIENCPIDHMKDITPILTAIAKSLEVDGSKEWIPIFNKLAGIEAEKIKISSPIDLAYQTYLECLTIKSYLQLGE